MKFLEIAVALLSPILPSLRLQIGQAPIQLESKPAIQSVPLDLTHLFNNRAVGPRANFDQYFGHSWVPEFMPSGLIEISGVKASTFPSLWEWPTAQDLSEMLVFAVSASTNMEW